MSTFSAVSRSTPTLPPLPPGVSPEVVEALLATLLARLAPALGLAPGPAPGPEAVPLRRLAAEVLELYRAPLRARTTRLRMAQALREVAELPGVSSTADLTPATVARFASARPHRRASTTNGLLASLRTACNLAVSWGYLRQSPFSGRSFRVRDESGAGPGPKRHHCRAEVARVLDHLRSRSATWEGHRLYALAAVWAYTGLRRREALQLAIEDVDLERGFLFVRRRRGLKTAGSAAPVPMPAALVEILRRWLPRAGEGCPWAFPGVTRSGPWTGGGTGKRAGDRLKAEAASIGVGGFTPQSLRRSLATHLAGHHGLSGKQIKMVLRHADEKTQDEHYIEPDLVNLAAMVRAFDFTDPAPAAAA